MHFIFIYLSQKLFRRKLKTNLNTLVHHRHPFSLIATCWPIFCVYSCSVSYVIFPHAYKKTLIRHNFFSCTVSLSLTVFRFPMVNILHSVLRQKINRSPLFVYNRQHKRSNNTKSPLNPWLTPIFPFTI